MTELEKTERAKMYIDKLATGINPITNTNVSEFDAIRDSRISGCFSYISEILGQIIENGGINTKKRVKALFSLDAKTRDSFDYSPEPICITEICTRINDLIDVDTMQKLKYSSITAWLVSLGMLQEITDSNNKNVKRPTSEGEALGISVEKRIIHSRTVYIVLYNIAAQMFIIDNLDAIIEHSNISK